MSADNWTRCPQCGKTLAGIRAALLDKIQRAYGIVSEDEYHEMLEELQNTTREPESILREDWDIGIREGRFIVKYHAECSKCGFSKVFEHREGIKL